MHFDDDSVVGVTLQAQNVGDNTIHSILIADTLEQDFDMECFLQEEESLQQPPEARLWGGTTGCS